MQFQEENRLSSAQCIFKIHSIYLHSLFFEKSVINPVAFSLQPVYTNCFIFCQCYYYFVIRVGTGLLEHFLNPLAAFEVFCLSFLCEFIVVVSNYPALDFLGCSGPFFFLNQKVVTFLVDIVSFLFLLSPSWNLFRCMLSFQPLLQIS